MIFILISSLSNLYFTQYVWSTCEPDSLEPTTWMALLAPLSLLRATEPQPPSTSSSSKGLSRSCGPSWIQSAVFWSRHWHRQPGKSYRTARLSTVTPLTASSVSRLRQPQCRTCWSRYLRHRVHLLSWSSFLHCLIQGWSWVPQRRGFPSSRGQWWW